MATNGVILINLGNRNSAEFDRILVPGSYEKALGAAIAGTYVTVHKWLYNGFAMTASLCTAEDKTDYISLVDKTNGGELMVYDDDTVTLVGAAIPVEPLNVTENGTYEATAPIRGFNPVSVDIPSSAPVINPISISENGTYTAPEGVDGYSPIVVDVEGGLITDIISLVDNKNVTSATGQTASVTTEEDYSAVAIVAFTVNTGRELAPTLSISGGIQLTQDRIVDGFYYGKAYFILAHAFDVPSGTTISAASSSNSASATLFVFGVAGGSTPDLGELTAFTNGVFIAADENLDGFSKVTVDTPDPVIESLSVSADGVYTAPAGVDGYSPITVDTPEPVIEPLSVSANGVYTAPSGVDGYSPMTVAVPPDIEAIYRVVFTKTTTTVGYMVYVDYITNKVPTGIGGLGSSFPAGSQTSEQTLESYNRQGQSIQLPIKVQYKQYMNRWVWAVNPQRAYSFIVNPGNQLTDSSVDPSVDPTHYSIVTGVLESSSNRYFTSDTDRFELLLWEY